MLINLMELRPSSVLKIFCFIKKGVQTDSLFYKAIKLKIYLSNLKPLSVAGLIGAFATLYPVRYIQSAIFFNLG